MSFFDGMGTGTQESAYVEKDKRVSRASEVQSEIEYLHNLTSSCTIDMAELLAEAVDAGFHLQWGFANIGDYTAERLDMSEREAFYRIKIVKVAKALAISKDLLQKAQISKLKEIFTLDPEGFFSNPQTNEKEPLDKHIVRLVELAPKTSLELIRAEVKRLKGIPEEEQFTFVNFQVPRNVKEDLVKPTLEQIKRECGDVMTKEGEVKDVSDGFCLEMLCAYYRSGMEEERLALLQAETGARFGAKQEEDDAA